LRRCPASPADPRSTRPVGSTIVPPASLSPTFRAGGHADITVREAALVWLGSWAAGNLVSGAVAAASGKDTVEAAGAGFMVAAAIALWAPMVAAVWAIGRRHGTGRLAEDFGFTFRPIDLLGVPLGVFSQLVVVRVVYLPLEWQWPDTFRRSLVEQRARELFEGVSGSGVVALIGVVVIGAPLVEELVYRGLLQGAFTRRLNDIVGWVIVAAWFAVVHFRPVEYPGLFVVGLVFGACALRTGRLGLGVVTHMAFNATGIALVARA